MSALLIELKKRRLELKFKQSDMMSRIGFSKQQYNHLERKGNRVDKVESQKASENLDDELWSDVLGDDS